MWPGRRRSENSPRQMGRDGAKRRGGADQEIDFFEPTIRRFAAALLYQGGQFALLLAIAFLLLAAFVQAPEPGRVIAVGDVHGNLDGLVAILQKTSLIDHGRRWSGGSATLVQTGDLLDRGPQSRAVLDLMIALQKEAPRRNGRVLVSLGNHEVMSMMSDLRYVVPEDYAAFADGRSEQRRKTAFQNYSKQQAERGRSVNEAAWMQAHAPGSIERQEAFGPQGAYGRWLRDLPAVNTVDASIFLHGGISPELSAWTVGKINASVRAELQAFDKYKQYMVDNKIAFPFFTFDELVSTAKAEVDTLKSKQKPGDETPEDIRMLEEFLRLGSWLSVNENGPLWFRGYSVWPDEEGEANLARLTQAFKVKRIVAGHTPQPNGEIRRRFGGMVYLIDTGMLSSYYPGGKAAALEISGDRIRAIYLDTQTELK